MPKVWSLVVDTKQAEYEAKRRMNELGALNGVAINKEYDKFTRDRLKQMRTTKFKCLKFKSLADLMDDEDIVEVMAGIGRNF